jgi:hypothetical protein
VAKCSDFDCHRRARHGGALARRGFKVFRRCKSPKRKGRPGISGEIRGLIRDVSLANPLWGAPRIHGELLNIGIDVEPSTVAKDTVQGRQPPSQP